MQQPWQCTNHPFPKGRGCRTQPVQRGKATLLYCPMLLDSLAAALPLCIINASVPQPWELPDVSWLCSSLVQKWQLSLICLKVNTQVLSCSVQVICVPTGGKDFCDWSRKSELADGRLCLDSKGTRNFQETWKKKTTLNLPGQICRDREKCSDIK